MKIKIIRLSKKDAHYDDRKKLIGLVGESEYSWDIDKKHGWKALCFIPDNNNPFHFSPIKFAYVKFEQVEDVQNRT